MKIPQETPPDRASDVGGEGGRGGVLLVYAGIVAAGALLISCFALWNVLYNLIGLLWPRLDLGDPKYLLRGLVRGCIALPIAAGALVFHYRLLKRPSVRSRGGQGNHAG